MGPDSTEVSIRLTQIVSLKKVSKRSLSNDNIMCERGVIDFNSWTYSMRGEANVERERGVRGGDVVYGQEGYKLAAQIIQTF
jgi:hypothetical protein